MSEPPPASAPVPASSSSSTVLPQGAKSLLPFDILRVGIHILRGWKWIILAGLLGGSGAFFVGWKEFTTKYTVQVQMVRQETQNNFQASRMGESFQPRQFNAATVSAMMKSSPLMEKTGASVKPTVPVEDLQQDLLIKPEKNTDLITVAWTESISKEHAVQTVNAYVENVVEMTKRLQAEEARDRARAAVSRVSSGGRTAMMFILVRRRTSLAPPRPGTATGMAWMTKPISCRNTRKPAKP